MKARNGKTKRQKKSKILIRIDKRIVHECPSLSSLRPKKKENQKIKYKFNLDTMNELKFSTTKGIITEIVLAPMLDARTV